MDLCNQSRSSSRLAKQVSWVAESLKLDLRHKLFDQFFFICAIFMDAIVF